MSACGAIRLGFSWCTCHGGRHLRRFFEDLIPLDDDFVATIHGFEYRLGLVQQKMRFRPLGGEYLGGYQWGGGDYEVSLAELSFRQAATRSQEWPWPDCLDGGDLDQSLINHRDVLKQYRRDW